MTPRALLLAALALTTAPAAAVAQLPGRLPPRPTARPPVDTTRRDTTARRDSAGRDTTAQRPIVQWAEEDSVMRSLLARQGYSVTRYQGGSTTFDAPNRSIYIEGDSSAVGRGQTILVADTIVYNDSTDIVRALGDTIVLRDPEHGSSDVVAGGSMMYNIREGRGIVTNIRTSSETGGQNWFVQGETSTFVQADTARARQAAFYAKEGTITSCDEREPHYHFESREVKMVNKNVMVARPAVLYIADVPVMWLPFIFQDLRSGRRSGMLTPRFGVSELFRNSPSYRRHIENFGYYFNLGDYMDATAAIDWRSGARATETDPGWIRYRGDWRYRWLDRFLGGGIAASYLAERGTSRELALSWNHQQDFSERSRVNANLNYSSNTRLKQRTSFLPAEVFAAITSQINFAQALGPASFSVGGTRKQYSGRSEINQEFPNVSLSTKPINLAPWLVWTPGFSASNSQTFNSDQPGSSAFRFVTGHGGALDSVRVKADFRTSTINFTTPLRIFDFDWRNSFRVSDQENDAPSRVQVPVLEPLPGGGDTSITRERFFVKTFATSIDWDTGIDLPRLFQGSWNLTPSVSIVNVVPQGGFFVRSQLTGGTFIHQSKRLQYGISSTPTFFGLFPGIGGIARFRHSINPVITYNYAAKAKADDEFLAGLGISRATYLSANTAQNVVSLSLSQNVEAKLKGGASDTTPEGGRKVKLVSLNFDPLSYDFERIKELRRRSANPAGVSRWSGLTNSTFGYRLTSELLPGFTFSSNYSLFQGEAFSDTAVFKPYRTSINATFSLNRSSGLVTAIGRLFGASAAAPQTPETQRPTNTAPTEQEDSLRQAANRPVAGGLARSSQFASRLGQGFNASFTFTSARQRPISGSNVIDADPTSQCAPLQSVDPVRYQQCLLNPTAVLGGEQIPNPTFGGQIVRQPPQTALTSDLNFPITPKWSGSWNTTYNFEEKQFASHVVTLERDLHDWRAIFAFTQAPNGNFAFSFFIALKAEPDLKFDYDRRTYRR